MLAAVLSEVDNETAVARNGFLLTAKLLILLERFGQTQVTGATDEAVRATLAASL